jgi:hypothetical protein
MRGGRDAVNTLMGSRGEARSAGKSDRIFTLMALGAEVRLDHLPFFFRAPRVPTFHPGCVGSSLIWASDKRVDARCNASSKGPRNP